MIARAGIVISLAELARAIAGTLVAADPAASATAYAIDSRDVEPGSVFFALVGARTDGHRYLADIHARGAVAAVVRAGSDCPPGLARIEVADTDAAIAALGRWFRDRGQLRVVGITGSAGKTTTKEFTASLLAHRFTVFKSEGNLNTTIGLPLTLSRRRLEHEVAVLEMGMSYPGELRRVARIAAPDVAVITNVGLAHAGNFATADDVALAKGEILEAVRPGGTMVANADDVRVMRLAAGFPGRVITFGIGATADVRAVAIEPLGAAGTRFTVETAAGRVATSLPVVGTHMVANAIAGLAIAKALGVDPLELAPQVAELAATAHRGVLTRLSGDVTIIDDCYNANPAAMLHALTTLATLPGRRIAVLGDMLELGQYSAASHREVGAAAAGHADLVIGVGPESVALVAEARTRGATGAQHVSTAAQAADLVRTLVRDGDAILVKGSRGIGLEAVVDALVATRGRA